MKELFSLPSCVPQWRHQEGNFFLGYVQSNWISLLFRTVFFLLARSSRLCFISYLLRLFYLLHSPLVFYFEVLQILHLQFS
jgi:hypothetical protein